MAYKIKGSFNRPLKGSVLDTITVNDNSFENWVKKNVVPKGIAKTLVWNWYGIDPTKVANFNENLSSNMFPEHQWGPYAYGGTPPWTDQTTYAPKGSSFAPEGRPLLEQLGKTALKGYSAIHNSQVAYYVDDGAAPVNLITGDIAAEYVDLVGTAEYTDSFDGKDYDIWSLYTNFDTTSSEFYSTYSNILVTAFCDWTYKNVIQEWDDNWQLPNPTKTYGAHTFLSNSKWSVSENLRTNSNLPGISTSEDDPGWDVVVVPPNGATIYSGDSINEETAPAFQAIMDYLGISENLGFPEWDSTLFQVGFSSNLPSWVKSIKIFPTSHERPGISSGAYLQWRYNFDQFEEFAQAVQQVGSTNLINHLQGNLYGGDAFKQKVNNVIDKFKIFDFYVTYAFEIEIEEGQIGDQFSEYGDSSETSEGFVGDLLAGQGMFEDEQQTSGTKYDPFIDADIYELIEKDKTKWHEDVPLATVSGATHYINFNPKSTKKIPLNLYPSLQNDVAVSVSGVNVLVDRLQHVVVTKEWVTGNPSFAEVELLSGEKGYIPTSLLYPVPLIEPKILEKEIIKPGPSKSVMAQVLVPPWQKNTKPYFYSERSEWWVTTTLPYTCVIDEEDLQNKKLEAIPIAVQRLLDYRNKDFSESEVSKIANGFLGGTAADVYLSTRPGSRLKVLVKIPSVYVEAVPVAPDLLGYDEKTDQVNFESDHERDGVRVKVGDLESSLRTALKAMVKFNQEYTLSNYYVQGFSFEKEIKRLASIPSLIKGLLSDNNLSYSELIAKGESDPCGNVKDMLNTLDFYFDIEDVPKGEGNCPDDDKVVKLGGVIYNSTEVPPENTPDPEMRRIELLKGIKDVQGSKVFSSPRTTALFLYHQNFSDPDLDWRTFIEKYCYDCKPKIVPRDKPYSIPTPATNNSSCTGDSKNDPNFMYAIPQVSFEDLFKKVALNFNSSLELDENSQIMPNLDLEFDLNFNLDFKSGMISQRNSMTSFTGDWFSSIDGLAAIELNISNGGLDSLFNYALKHIDFGSLFGSLGSYYTSSGGFSSGGDFDSGGFGGIDGFGMGGFGSGGFGGGSSGGFELGEFNGGDISNIGIDGAFDFALEMPSFSIRLPTINLLETFNDFLIKSLEKILVSILVALIIFLLRSLSEKEKAESCGTPEGQEAMPTALNSSLTSLSYGEQNLNDMLSDSIGVYEEDVYQDRMLDIFVACGIPIAYGNQEGVPKDIPKKFMDDVSSMISSKEMLLLMQGSCPDDVLGEIQFLISDSYPKIGQYLSNMSKIEDFFLCFGGSISSKVIETISEDVGSAYKNPEVCFDIKKEIEKAMEERCPVASFRASIFEKELVDPINTYRKIITILSQKRGDIFDGVDLFDCEDGTPGLLSQEKPQNLDYVIEKATDALFASSKVQLEAVLNNYFDKLMIFKSPLGSESAIRDMGTAQFLLFNGALDLPGGIPGVEMEQSNKIGGDFRNRFDNLSVEKIGGAAYTVKDSSPKMQVGGEFSGNPLLYTQGADGTSYLTPYITDKQAILKADPFYPMGKLLPAIEEIINNYKPVAPGTSLNEKVLGAIFATQLSAFVNPGASTLNDIMATFPDLYGHICSSTIESIGKKISNNKGAIKSGTKVRESQYVPYNKSIQEYSSNLARKQVDSDKGYSYSHQYLVPFHNARKVIKENINFSSYDDPTNPNTIESTQSAMLMGLLNVLADVYTTDLILQGVFSFLVYDFQKMGKQPYIGEYILEKMKLEVDPKFLSILQDVSYSILVADLKSLPGGMKGNQPLVNKYLSTDRAMLYYIDKSLARQVIKVRNRMPSAVKTSFLPFAELIWSSKLNPVQIYEKETANPTWVEPMSLWSEDHVGQFNRGKFFLEYYVRVYEYEQGEAEYNDLWANRDISKKGILNPEELRSYLEDLVSTNGLVQVYGFDSSELSMSDLFKEVRYGVRMSYGFVVQNEITPEPLKEFAKQIKDAYNSFSTAQNSAQLLKAYFIEEPGGTLAPGAGSEPKDQYIIPLFSSTESYEDVLIKDFDVNVQLTAPANQEAVSEQNMEPPSYSKLLKTMLSSELYDCLINVGIPIHEFISVCVLYNMQIISNPSNTDAATAFADLKNTVIKSIELTINAKRYDYEAWS